METYRLISAQDNATGEYRQVKYMKMEEEASRMNQIWLLGFIVVMVSLAFVFLARNFGKLPSSFRLGPREIVLGVIVLFATLLTQIWMHVLILRFYGARPEFRLLRNSVIGYISAPGYGLRRNSVILAALTPPVVLFGLSLIGIWLAQGTSWVALFALIAVVTAAASTSHLWVTAMLLRYPSRAWTVDDGHGMRILLPMEPGNVQ